LNKECLFAVLVQNMHCGKGVTESCIKNVHINSAMEENSIWNSGRMLNDRLTGTKKKMYKCYVLT